jgi:DNA-binding NarL/FixJ family response regulator
MSDHAKSCVLLADRHQGLIEGMRGLLQTVFGRVFVVSDEASLLEGAERLQPALVVVDLSLGAKDALGLLTEVKALAPAAKLLVLSVHDEPTVACSAIAAGADGVVLKRAIATDLTCALDAVLAGQRYISPDVAAGGYPEDIPVSGVTKL